MALNCYIDTTGIQVDTNDALAAIVKDSSGNLWCLYVVGTSLYCRRSTNGGITWEAAVTVVTESYSGVADGIEFDAAIDSSDIIHVVYRVRTDGATVNTLYYIYRDPTTGWSVKEDILGVTAYYKYPKIAIDASNDIHAVYHKGLLGAASVKYVKSTSGVWGSEENVATKWSIGITSSYAAQDICVDGSGNIHVVYEGGSVTYDLYYKLNNGAWQAEETIAGFNDSNKRQVKPVVAVDSSNVVHVVWSGKGYGATNPTVSQLCYTKGNTGAWDAVSALTDVTQPQGATYGLAVAINDLSEIDICWAGARWSVTNPAWITGNNIKYSGSWSSVVVVSDYNITSVLNMVSARFPSSAIMASGYIALMNSVLLATVTTNRATEVGPASATLNGTLDHDGGEACDCGFEWGETTAYGNTTPTQSRTTGQTFSQSISGLYRNKTYHFRAFATNSVGTGYGADRTFSNVKGNPHIDQLMFQHVERMER